VPRDAVSAALKTARRAKAKNRLTEMEVQEVSLVDRPANQRSWLVLKRAAPIKLPPGAKAALMDALGKILDQAAAMATVVSEATESAGATVPRDIPAALVAGGEMLLEEVDRLREDEAAR
jgi:hypothetical protein